MNKQGFWDLSVLYKGFSDPLFSSDISSLKKGFDDLLEFLQPIVAEYKEFIKEKSHNNEKFFEKKFDSVDEQITVCEFVIRNFQEIERLYSRLSNYVQLILSVDATNSEALAQQDIIDGFEPTFQIALSTFSRYMSSVKEIDFLIEKAKDSPCSDLIQEHAFFLKEAKEASEHLLPSEIEETVFTMQKTGSQSWEKLRNMLDGLSTVSIEENGKIVELPLPQVRSMAYSEDKATRKKAYIAELESYKKTKTSLAFALHGIKAEAVYLSKLKGYNSLLEETLDDSRMTKKILDTMFSSIKKTLPVFWKYFKKKAEFLGYSSGLPFYDLFAPLSVEGEQPTKKFTVESARTFLIKVLGGFSKKMADFIDYAFENDWIDIYPREGKGGGAFCQSLHSEKQSRVLTNFSGSFSDVCTFAHELGHAYHDSCLKDESILNSDYPMPLAETASIFNETLVTQGALAEASKEKSFTLLEAEISDAAQVIVDIYSRFLFEEAVVAASEARRLSPEDLEKEMLKAQKEAYGDGLDKDWMHCDLWVCKCHYYLPDYHFYNFPYAFGLLFAKGLYSMYQKDKINFPQTYDKILQSTSTNRIKEVGLLAGIDFESEEFWDKSLGVISSDIEKFCVLVDEFLAKRKC